MTICHVKRQSKREDGKVSMCMTCERSRDQSGCMIRVGRVRTHWRTLADVRRILYLLDSQAFPQYEAPTEAVHESSDGCFDDRL